MAQVLQTNLLLQSVGFPVKNHKGKPVGKIADVISGRDRRPMEYVILQSENLYGNKDRFFAVPASTAWFKITTGGKVVLKADTNELQRAKRITFDQRPKPAFHFEPLIFELDQYNQRKNRKQTC